MKKYTRPTISGYSLAISDVLNGANPQCKWLGGDTGDQGEPMCQTVAPCFTSSTGS